MVAASLGGINPGAALVPLPTEHVPDSRIGQWLGTHRAWS